MGATYRSLEDLVKEMKNSKTIFGHLEFKDKGIVHFKKRLSKAPKAFVNRFSIDSDGNKLCYSFNISTIVGSYEVTTVSPDIAKHLSNCFIDDQPFDLFKTI